jgi:hypothetical protein
MSVCIRDVSTERVRSAKLILFLEDVSLLFKVIVVDFWLFSRRILQKKARKEGGPPVERLIRHRCANGLDGLTRAHERNPQEQPNDCLGAVLWPFVWCCHIFCKRSLTSQTC